MKLLYTFALVFMVCGGVACSTATVNRPYAPDSDKDGVPNSADLCPNEPEDYDGYLDADGCPDFDGSDHAILDVEDRCPIVLDCEGGISDFDGCPDVFLVFERNGTALTKKHLEIIDELAEEIMTRKMVKRLRIDGYFATDEAAALAAQRSELVRERLIALGVASVMLTMRAADVPDGASGFVSFFALECT
ncbi:MAG: hypothetical protein JKY56_18485 [Kofleriaceae bacterium]|nr:hypothetical protein [Kofleriaceae bacterium]